MQIGGIETYIYKMVKYLKNQSVLTGMAHCDGSNVATAFYDELYDGETIIWSRNINRRELESIVKTNNVSNIKIITFTPATFVLAERIKRTFKHCIVDTFYYVPNFTKTEYYYEGAYSGCKSALVKRVMANFFSKMNENSNIRYFAPNHIDKMTETYGYQIQEEKSLLVPPTPHNTIFSEERVRKVYNNETFNLLTVSRFEFPHKGYLIGLIKEFTKLKKIHPKSTLTIVGYGSGENLVRDTILQQPADVQKDIVLVGAVSPDNLGDYYDKANLNISVAGCCSTGAKRGVLSIPARHYTYDCEVYAPLPESRNLITSTLPGNPVLPIIESILQMSYDEYYQLSKKSFDAYNVDTESNILETSNIDPNKTISRYDDICVRCIYHGIQLKSLINSLLKHLHEVVYEKQ